MWKTNQRHTPSMEVPVMSTAWILAWTATESLAGPGYGQGLECGNRAGDTYTQRTLRRRHERQFQSGRQIVSGGRDDTLKLWDVRPWTAQQRASRQIAELAGQQGIIVIPPTRNSRHCKRSHQARQVIEGSIRPSLLLLHLYRIQSTEPMDDT
jgi:hypothetical protein